MSGNRTQSGGQSSQQRTSQDQAGDPRGQAKPNDRGDGRNNGDVVDRRVASGT